MSRFSWVVFLTFSSSLFIFSCANYKFENDDLRTKVATTALNYVGETKILYNGKYYDFDCSGFVKFVLLSCGIDIDSKVKIFSFSKTIDYYNIFKLNDRLFREGIVRPGDLVFFDNTYDRNNNKRFDDKLTHIGMVVGVDRNTKSILFVDKSRGKKVTLKSINLSWKNVNKIVVDGTVYEVNSYVRDDDLGKFLASEVFAGFGDISVLFE